MKRSHLVDLFPSPLLNTCPLCNAPPGEPCRSVGTVIAHASRYHEDEALALAYELRKPAPSVMV